MGGGGGGGVFLLARSIWYFGWLGTFHLFFPDLVTLIFIEEFFQLEF